MRLPAFHYIHQNPLLANLVKDSVNGNIRPIPIIMVTVMVHCVIKIGRWNY